MRLQDFDFELPTELIAQYPPDRRGDSRLLYLDSRNGSWEDRRFTDLLSYIGPDDLLVFNDTRVIKARLYAHKKSGGRAELLIERLLGKTKAIAYIKASHAPGIGSTLTVEGGEKLAVIGRQNELYQVEFASDVLDVLEKWGHVPLPPYIKRPDIDEDSERYQTVYARSPGAVAAPTAGLHFDENMLKRIESRGAKIAYVTLHVGAGTFSPLRSEDILSHKMHSEWYEVSQATAEMINAHRSAGGCVLAVGTTSLRALEGSSKQGVLLAGTGETDLFITPGYCFQVVDRLMTNFHLPRSTLFMLVSAFSGTDLVRRAYAHAVSERYRFFSYGDAMLLERSGAVK
ncbi:MAG: tRNA preQ1(34) S-adenosylmethionine ribosyltransferase-isomerase QueA [Proteobacteria bacterium]|nr:tRNA preQ1(34) S-adenosylmethionine ribosyltransferase-isomerase QueA [Pseudomonadota bacterium]